MFSTIVRYADNNDLIKSISLSDISGIVVIDEIELHLHTNLQKEVLPKLINLFPKVQFIITSHAPLFLLGMQEVFGDDGYEIYEMPMGNKITVERFSEFQKAYEYFKLTQTYQKDAEEAIAKFASSSKTLVITEGATDWKHMQTALKVLKIKEEYSDLFAEMDFDFLEHEPCNSFTGAKYKLEMGDKLLTSICENYAQMPQDKKFIFIADCDVKGTVEKLGNSAGKYKKWAEKVFSFTLPVPDHRKNTPNISIEHLFTDNEIKKNISCQDGIQRRLYMGNEFDKHGHSKSLNLFCERKDICGENKINILEATKLAMKRAIERIVPTIDSVSPALALLTYGCSFAFLPSAAKTIPCIPGNNEYNPKIGIQQVTIVIIPNISPTFANILQHLAGFFSCSFSTIASPQYEQNKSFSVCSFPQYLQYIFFSLYFIFIL